MLTSKLNCKFLSLFLTSLFFQHTFRGIFLSTFSFASSKRLRRSFDDECPSPNQGNNPINLGTVDGKTYYAEQTRRTWHATRSYCKGLGMELATITSEAQANFLKLAFDSSKFSEEYWLGGRDSFQPRQFSWDRSGEAVTALNKFLWFKDDTLLYQTCLVYESEKVPNILMYDCEFDGMQALCEE